MAWSISTNKLPAIHSFADAAAVWNGASPWSREHTSWRPLDSRRAVHKRIVKLYDGSYQCVLHQTPVVTYLEDGSVKLRCHDSRSTQAFAWYMRPRGCCPASAQGQMFWKVITDEGNHFYREGYEPLTLIPTQTGNWQLTTKPAPVVELVNDRAKRAFVRKQVKPFEDWHAATTRLLGRRLSSWTYRITQREAYAILHTLNDPEHYLEVAQRVSPEQLREALYLATGGIYKSPVPYTRLPRNRI